MKNDSDAILCDLLRRYHAWAKGYRPTPSQGADPMFRNVKSGRSFDTTDEIIEDELMGSTMEAIDFHISELPEDEKRPFRSAIYGLARNLHAGASVWTSPRLPKDEWARAEIVGKAKRLLTNRLMAAGVM